MTRTIAQQLTRGKLAWCLILLLTLTESCFRNVKPATTITGVVQDSTGKPLPDAVLTFDGIKGGIPAVGTNSYEVTTDSSGTFSQILEWEDGTVDYGISFIPHAPYTAYEIYDCPPLQDAPLRISCSISYFGAYALKDVPITILVRKRQLVLTRTIPQRLTYRSYRV